MTVSIFRLGSRSADKQFVIVNFKLNLGLLYYSHENPPHDFICQGHFKEKRPKRPCILNRSAVRAPHRILCRRFQRKTLAGYSPSLFRAPWN
ncbi:hypothetical protein TNCV_4038891 [Trichonephila clavipes]|nr:hypothetical protein TNCV_4038891 [Trichonephila clavipes]